METINSNMDIAVEQMLNRWEGLPFEQLITKLRNAGYAPSIEEVQSILCNMAKEGCLLITEGNRLRYHEDAHVLPRYDLFPFVLVYDPPYTLGTLAKDFTLTQDDVPPWPVHVDAPAEEEEAAQDEAKEEPQGETVGEPQEAEVAPAESETSEDADSLESVLSAPVLPPDEQEEAADTDDGEDDTDAGEKTGFVKVFADGKLTEQGKKLAAEGKIPQFVTQTDTESEDDEPQEERDPWSDFQGGRVMGMFGHWRDAWRAANTDFIGDPNCGRTIYRWNGTAFELDSYAAQATPVVMPPAPQRTETEYHSTYSPSAEKLRESEKIDAEISAVVDAVESSLDKTVYTKLREESDDSIIKISLSVEVDLDKEIVTSKMSGSVKVSAKGNAKIKDPAQGELPLDDK